MSNSSTAHKRTTHDIQRDRARIAELMHLRHTHNEMADMLAEETGVALSRKQIEYDIHQIRKAWRKTQMQGYQEYVNQELARLDTLEREIWRALRESAGEKHRKTIEEIARSIGPDKNEAEIEMMVSRIVTTIEPSGVNPVFFNQIIECQKERRRVLGVYAPNRVDVNETREVNIKMFATVGPEVWPGFDNGEDVINGETIRALPDGERDDD